ncbi:MAG: hypothetical protein KKH57_02410 [Candidatus Omnitrophica bacterium]|nr:hypothetical protein [Candidatus Omnitrophota bacterium]
MKKVFLLIQQTQIQVALESLRSLGLVHVEHENIPSGLELNEINEKLSLIEQAKSVLSAANQKYPVKHIIRKTENLDVACRHIIDLQKRYNQLREYSVTLNSRIDLWEPWGDFDPLQIKALQQKNISIKCYQIPRNKINSLPPGILLKKISKQGGLINCLAFST